MSIALDHRAAGFAANNNSETARAVSGSHQFFNGQEKPSMQKYRPARADTVHNAAVGVMISQMRGVRADMVTKSSFDRSIKTVAQACRVYLSFELAVMDEPVRPKGFRCNALLEDFLKAVKNMLAAAGVSTVEQDLPGPHGFRRALRDYQRARTLAVKSLATTAHAN